MGEIKKNKNKTQQQNNSNKIPLGLSARMNSLRCKDSLYFILTLKNQLAFDTAFRLMLQHVLRMHKASCAPDSSHHKGKKVREGRWEVWWVGRMKWGWEVGKERRKKKRKKNRHKGETGVVTFTFNHCTQLSEVNWWVWRQAELWWATGQSGP